LRRLIAISFITAEWAAAVASAEAGA
jgi:hypothetical protein